ncbi:DUF4157 domain-containing protein [Calothrix rhizosoleniae]|uniref:eCIS core domain-containing protein n=1 Tax=Calothrix rhizosoleniae TaxID=888997 RepID=UPI000B497907|nr:DUF4157 domain-containing protein [Calothrix rhizosoleniae]
MKTRSPTQTQNQISSFTPVPTGLLQRKCSSCGQNAVTGGKCSECSKKQQLLQRHATNQAESSEIPPIVHEVLRSPGQSLDKDIRGFMEPRFGHDFSHVRVHTDGRAAQSARAIDALAYTVGENVVFGQGQYAPKNNSGKQLLAHELSHVVQQSNSIFSNSSPLAIDEAGSKFEAQAEQSANQVIHGSVPQPMSQHQTTMVQRKTNDSSVPSPLPLLPRRDLQLSVTTAELAASEALSASNPKLVSVAKSFQDLIATNPQAYIEISGYLSSDSRYSSAKEKQNRRQILQRFDLVKTTLIGLGVPADKIEIQTSPPFSDKRGGIIEVEVHKKRASLLKLPFPPTPSPKPGQKLPTSTPATGKQSTGGGFKLPDFSKYTKFSINIFGDSKLNFDLPSSVAAELPFQVGDGKQVIMEFKAQTSQVFSFSIKVKGLPQVELGASASVNISGEKPKGKFEVGATATKQVCHAENAKSLKSQMQAKGKELVDAVNAFNAARKNNDGSFDSDKDMLEKAGKVGGKLKDLYDLRKKAMESCKPVPIGSLKIVGQGGIADPNKPPEKLDLNKPEPLGNSIMLIFEWKF